MSPQYHWTKKARGKELVNGSWKHYYSDGSWRELYGEGRYHFTARVGHDNLHTISVSQTSVFPREARKYETSRHAHAGLILIWTNRENINNKKLSFSLTVNKCFNPAGFFWTEYCGQWTKLRGQNPRVYKTITFTYQKSRLQSQELLVRISFPLLYSFLFQPFSVRSLPGSC